MSRCDGSLACSPLSSRIQKHVTDHGDDDDGAAEEGPGGGALAENEEDPDWIQDWFDVADDARIQ